MKDGDEGDDEGIDEGDDEGGGSEMTFVNVESLLSLKRASEALILLALCMKYEVLVSRNRFQIFLLQS